MKITAYQVANNALPIVSANVKRDIMDNSSHKFAYRCLPMIIGNSYGWEIQSNSEFIVKYDGGTGVDSIQVLRVSGNNFPESHFGNGVFTWHPGYLFKTEYPYGLYVTGKPNTEASSAIPLTAIVETYWLPFTFTMNWTFTQKGLFHMKPGDTVCQIFPVDMTLFNDVDAEILDIKNDPELFDDYIKWTQSRNEHNKNPNRQFNDWQKNYFQGTFPHKEGKELRHMTNLNVPEFTIKND